MAADSKNGQRIVKGQNYYLPAELARHVWRLACEYDDRRSDVGGASESGMMVVAWENLLAKLDVEQTYTQLARCASWRGVDVTTDRKCYAVPNELLKRIDQRWRAVAMASMKVGGKRPARSHLAELAQILLVELAPKDRDALVNQFDVRKRRK